jgi:prepilin-type processing-associated H-X9-DG protein
VCAISAILAAVLGTVAMRARQSAATTTCVANLSQIGKGLLLYAHDWDDVAPPYTTAAANGDELLKGTNGKRWKESLMRYGVVDEQFFCPADGHAQTRWQPEFAMGEVSRLYSTYHTSIMLTSPRYEVNGIPHLILSNFDFDHYYACDASVRFALGEDNVLHSYSGHGNRINALFVDGHVKPWFSPPE